jgi:hypothetical protein
MDILRREYSDLRIFRARDILSYGHSELRTVYSYGHFELLSAVHRIYSEEGIFSRKSLHILRYGHLQFCQLGASFSLAFGQTLPM